MCTMERKIKNIEGSFPWLVSSYQTSGQEIMRFVLNTTLLWKRVPYFLELTQSNSSMIFFCIHWTLC